MLTVSLVSFLIALLVTPLVIKHAKKVGLVDDPKKRSHPATLHASPVPRGGGIPILLSILTATLVSLPLNSQLIGILAGAAFIFVIGIMDDRHHISPFTRLVMNGIAGVVVVASGITIPFVTNPFGGVINLEPLISAVLVIFWVIAVTNTVSWSSGVDGQLAGFVPIAAATIGALSLKFTEDVTQWPVILLSIAVAGAYLGFLPFSVYPQRIMPGYSGGALAGYFLAVLAIISGAKVATAAIVLAIPIIDALFTVMRRIINKKSPFWADRGHLHHRLLAIGWTRAQVALFYWIIAGALGFLVLHLNSTAKFYTIFMLTLAVGALIIWLTKSNQLLNQQDQPTG
ncbi:undecaprenyl/decaprenyl-phosphate alpha-N-acetylglucosaminyl 1-phosphate transferase [Candidatus Microgenomates bacterium]|nr:undecaprenyl/decaprenyl-phosphate alpha-N-acetylglucosaminyl 1-phosphate transferase [Candidatus Microgenomates bacterium]